MQWFTSDLHLGHVNLIGNADGPFRLRSTYLTRPDVLDALAEVHQLAATEQARSTGLLDSDGPGFWTRLHRGRLLYGTARSSPRSTGPSPATPD